MKFATTLAAEWKPDKTMIEVKASDWPATYDTPIGSAPPLGACPYGKLSTKWQMRFAFSENR